MTPEQIDAYYTALLDCAKRYASMASVDDTLLTRDPQQALSSFIAEFNQAIVDRLPLLKLNRWLGYIQGVLIARGCTDVETERDFTRPYFRPIDFF